MPEGGGGIPIWIKDNGDYEGLEAVIDKDRTSVLLAVALDADDILVVTSVPCLYINFGKPDQRALSEVGLEEVLAYQKEGQFPPGSMGPKIEAAAAFLAKKGGTVIITDAAHLVQAVAGKAGTRIVHEKASKPARIERTTAVRKS